MEKDIVTQAWKCIYKYLEWSQKPSQSLQNAKGFHSFIPWILALNGYFFVYFITWLKPQVGTDEQRVGTIEPLVGTIEPQGETDESQGGTEEFSLDGQTVVHRRSWVGMLARFCNLAFCGLRPLKGKEKRPISSGQV